MGITRAKRGKRRLLDVTRLTRRSDRRATGIDRVVMAYARELLKREDEIWALARTRFGYVLLDREGLRALLTRLDGTAPWGARDALSRIPGRQSDQQKRAESDVRRLRAARALPTQLRGMLQRVLGPEFTYLNVGHSNFTSRVLAAVKGAGGQVVAMVHDTIPLDYAHLQPPSSVRRFTNFLQLVEKNSDLVLCNSHVTEADVLRYMCREEPGPLPPTLVAHLGVEVAEADAKRLPVNLPPSATYFVSVGTLEPRKNHILLLDIWEQMAKEMPPQLMPHLVLCGARGWKNEVFFARLERSPLRDVIVHEVSGLDDEAMAALVSLSAGMLFPSIAEGYGLPPMEALALGTPVLCGNLAVYQEVLGENAVYASVDDAYLWRRKIIQMTDVCRAGKQQNQTNTTAWSAPKWSAHFNLVLNRI